MTSGASAATPAASDYNNNRPGHRARARETAIKTGLERAFKCARLDAVVTSQNCYVEKDGKRWQRLQVRFRRVGTQYQWAPVGSKQREVEALLNAKFLTGYGEVRTLSDEQMKA